MSIWSSSISGDWALTSMEADRRQCCPMDTYDTDAAGNLRPVCSCGDDCECVCLDCRCDSWGEEYDDEP